MSASLPDIDPFAANANADDYVPRLATDQAFADLERAVLSGARPVALTGPPGLGKTLLLQRLVAKVSTRFTPVYLPYASLAPDELCGWALAVLNGEPTDDPIGVFRAYLHRLSSTGKGLLLVIDDASVLPLATGRWLARFAGTSRGALRVALAAGDSPSSLRKLAALGESMEIVRLIDPMDEEETRAYLEARLDAAGVTGPRRALFDSTTIRGLYTVSRGNPRRLHAAATAVLLGRAPDSVAEFQSEASSILAQDDAVLSALIARDHPEAPSAAASEVPDPQPVMPGAPPTANVPASPPPPAAPPPASAPAAAPPESPRPSAATELVAATPSPTPADVVPGDEVAIEDEAPEGEPEVDGPVPGDEIPVGPREAAPAVQAPPAAEPLPEAEVVPEYREVAAMQSAAHQEIVPEDEVPIEEQSLDPEPPPEGWLRPPAPRRIEQAPALMWVMIATLAVAVAAITLPLLRGSLGTDRALPDAYMEPRVPEVSPRVDTLAPPSDPWGAPLPIPTEPPPLPTPGDDLAGVAPLPPVMPELPLPEADGLLPLPSEPPSAAVAPPDPRSAALPVPPSPGGERVVAVEPAVRASAPAPTFVVVPDSVPAAEPVAREAAPTPAVTPRPQPEPAPRVAVAQPPEPRPEPVAPRVTPAPRVAVQPAPARRPAPRPAARRSPPVVAPAPAPTTPDLAIARRPQPGPPAVTRTPLPGPPEVQRLPLPGPPAEVQPAPPVAAIVSVSVNASPWAVIEVNGREVGETPLAGIPLAPGRHEFRARLPNGKVLTKTVPISDTNRAVVFD